MKLLGMILTSCLVLGCDFELQPWFGSITTYDHDLILQNHQDGTSFKLEAGSTYDVQMVQTLPSFLSTRETWTMSLESTSFSVQTSARDYAGQEYVLFFGSETGQEFDLKVAYTPEVTSFEERTYLEGGKCFIRYVFTDEIEVEFLHPATRQTLASGLISNTYPRVKEIDRHPCR